MPVNLSAPERLESVPGVRAGAVSLGVRKVARDDLAVLTLDAGATAAATFTRNAFCAAPVHVARRHLAAAAPRVLVINAGNANAGTGAPGMAAAERVCDLVAQAAGCRREEVLPFSTGVVGEVLDTAPFEAAVPRALAAAAEDGWLAAGRAIMTTDIVAKGVSRHFDAGGRRHTVTGIAKGSGMIRPDMATMLAFLATGDTSTNDACVLVASGAGAAIDDPHGADATALADAVTAVCTTLAQAIVRDGEGATKFITVRVQGGRDDAECRQVAYTVAHSPLVKTAMYASDANWGRILAAVGRAGVPDLDVEPIRMHLGDVLIVENGARAPGYREEQGAAVMAGDEILVRIDLGRGAAAAEVWTCDLSHEYVTINGEYRT